MRLKLLKRKKENLKRESLLEMLKLEDAFKNKKFKTMIDFD